MSVGDAFDLDAGICFAPSGLGFCGGGGPKAAARGFLPWAVVCRPVGAFFPAGWVMEAGLLSDVACRACWGLSCTTSCFELHRCVIRGLVAQNHPLHACQINFGVTCRVPTG